MLHLQSKLDANRLPLDRLAEVVGLMGFGATITTLVLRVACQLLEFHSVLLFIPACLQGAHVHFMILAFAAWITGHDFAPFASTMFQFRAATGSMDRLAFFWLLRVP